MNQAIILSGASAQEASAGLTQFSQGIASGVLRGEELNSILEQTPVIADVIAKSMGKTRGELRALGSDGKITAEVIMKAFREAEYLGAAFATTVPTIGQAFTVLTNQVMKYLGAADKSLGTSEAFARLILKAAENMDTLIAGVTAVSAGLLVMAGPTVLGAVLNGLRALGVLILANPLGALATAAAAVVTWLIQMDRRFDPILQKLNLTVTFVDRFRAAWAGAKAYVQAVWEDFPEWLLDIGKQAVNGLVSATATGLNKIQEVIGNVFGREFEPLDVSGLMMELSGAGAKAANAYNEAFKQALIDSGKQLGSISTTAGPNLAKPVVDEKAAKKAAQELERLTQQYNSLRDTLDPLGAATRDWAAAETLLNTARKAGLVDQKTYNDLIKAAAQHYTELAYPVTQLRREIERQTELLKVEIDQREILDTLYRQEKEMRRALTDVEKEDIAIAIQRHQLMERETSLLENIKAPYDNHLRTMEAADSLFRQGKISAEEYATALDATALAVLDLDKSVSGGLNRGVIRLREEFTDLASVAEQGLVNAFRGAEDALVSFVQTGKVDFKKLIDSMVADLIRLAIRQQIMGFAANMLGGMIGGAKGPAPITVATPVAPRRALGGPVLANQAYSINERRQPELLSVGGKDYLTMGSQSGHVSSMSGGGGAPRMVVIEPVIYNNAADSVQATTEAKQDDQGNVSLSVMITKIEREIAANVQSGNSPLLKSMGSALGVSPKPRGR